MQNINDVYLYCNTLMRKQFSGSLSADEFNLLIPIAQLLHMRVKIGLPETYHIGLGYPAQGARRATVIIREAAQELEASQILDDQIRNFIQPILLNGANNIFQVPADYIAYRPSNYKYVWQVFNEQTEQWETKWRWVPFEFVNAGKRTYRLYAYIQKPSPEYPIISYNAGQLQVDADQLGLVNISQIQLFYVRAPKVPFRNYTTNVNDQPIYNPVGSQDLEFPNIEWEEIAQRLIKYWAIAIRETEVFQLTDKAVEGGQ